RLELQRAPVPGGVEIGAPRAGEIFGVTVTALEAHGVGRLVELVELRPDEDSVAEVHLPMRDERAIRLLLHLDVAHGVAQKRMAPVVADDLERLFGRERRVAS